MDYQKPLWKIRLETSHQSLPDYWSMVEIEKELHIANGYAYRLCQKYHLETWKIGSLRFLKDKDFQWLATNYEKR